MTTTLQFFLGVMMGMHQVQAYSFQEIHGLGCNADSSFSMKQLLLTQNGNGSNKSPKMWATLVNNAFYSNGASKFSGIFFML